MTYATFVSDHLAGVLGLCEQEGWPSLPSDSGRALTALTAPGVVTIVALEGSNVIGFGQMLSDGEVTAYLALVVVAKDHRRQGIGRRLVEECFRRTGALRVDLIAEGESDGFYRAFRHRSFPGFRLYPSGEPARREA